MGSKSRAEKRCIPDFFGWAIQEDVEIIRSSSVFEGR